MTQTIYRNAELIPITQEGVLCGYDLFTENGMITRISPTGGEIPADTTVVDCYGKYLLPGLIDAHIHLMPGYENDFKVLTAYGITSARNMWGNQPFDLETPELDSSQISQDLAEGKITGPTLVNTSRILDGTPPVQVASRNVNTQTDAMLFIKEALREGAAQLKVYKNIITEVMDALHILGIEHDLRVVGHVPDEVLSEDFFSKAHSVEHTMTFALEDVEALRRSACLFVPTLVVEKNMDQIASGGLTALAAWGQAHDIYLNPGIGEIWQMMSGEEMLERIKELANYELAVQKVKRFVELGGIPAVGTDFPNPYCYPGISVHQELALLGECGLSNQQVLVAATRQSARVLEIEDRKGTLEIGKDADLLLLNANPLEDIGNTLSIDSVVLRGRHYNRRMLDGLLEEAAKEIRAARETQEVKA